MKKVIITSLISLSTCMALSITSAQATTGDYRPAYAFYLGTGVSFDINNSDIFEDPTLHFQKSRKHFIIPEVFLGYNLDLTSGMELNFSDNKFTNSNPKNALIGAGNVLESDGYTGMVQFIGNYPLTYDQKLNAYGLLGIGATYWRSALNGEDTTSHLNASGVIGAGLAYKIIDEIEVSAGYKFSYLGKAYETTALSSNRVFRHQLELRLKFNI